MGKMEEKARDLTINNSDNSDNSVKVYTVPEVARILHVNKGYVYDLIYTGKLKASRLSERRFRIRDEELSNFLKQEEGWVESK
jgi:excisionase family DNA binding protein